VLGIGLVLGLATVYRLAEARALNFLQRETILSLAKKMTNHP